MAGPGSHAVFLSYASQDAEAARRICEALRAAAVEVWFDQSDLRGGDAWDHRIRQQIRDCALFIPVISANTASRGEGYFRLEWGLAEQRTQMMARSKVFIVPVCVDATREDGADVPDSFLRAQWTRLPGGETPPAFSARIAGVLGIPTVTSPAAAVAVHGAIQPPPVTAPPPRRTRLIAVVAGAVLVLAVLVAWQAWRLLPGRSSAGSAPQVADSASNSAEKSVAVLPFTDMSEKHDQEYFSDGLAEELIDALTRIPNLRVPARTSSFSFKGKPTTVGEIAHVLGVTHVLEGSVRKSGDHLRITAQLVRADSGFDLWSQTYDRNVRDIFAVQDDIAHAVAERLRITLLGSSAAAPQPTSTDAHNLYLQARYLTGRDTADALNQAVTLYQQALALDPKYAPAWAWLAFTHVRRVGQGLDTSGTGFAKAIEAAQRAIAADPRVIEAYDAIAGAHMQYDFNWGEANRALDKALALDPQHALTQQMKGHMTVVTGRMSEALVHFRASVDGDPLNCLHHKYLGRALYYAGRPAEAAEELRHAIDLNAQFPGLHYELGRALLMLKQPEAALAAFAAEADATWKSNGMPLGYAALHREQETRASLAALVADSAGAEFQVAEAYAFAGEKSKAFEWLERARTQHDPGVIYARRDYLLASLANDPRFAAFISSIGQAPVPKDD